MAIVNRYFSLDRADLVHAGAIPAILELMQNPALDADTAKECSWSIFDISKTYRRKVEQAGGIIIMLSMLLKFPTAPWAKDWEEEGGTKELLPNLVMMLTSFSARICTFLTRPIVRPQTVAAARKQQERKSSSAKKRQLEQKDGSLSNERRKRTKKEQSSQTKVSRH